MATGNTTTDDTVGWQTGPKDRGTATLIWGCVTTIFACSWTILHLNVPALTDSAWTRFLRKAKWMAITIVFPEFILSEAICDLRLALHELCQFDDCLRRDEEILKWTAQYENEREIRNHEWNWRVEYPRHARWLYRLLFLKPPHERGGKSPSSPDDRESEGMELKVLNKNVEEQEQGEKGRRQQQQDREQEKQEGEGETNNPQNSRAVLERTLDAWDGSSGPIDRGREPSPSNKSSRSSERATSSQLPQKPSRLEQRTQTWTLVHSYFAQMGGLAYVDMYDNSNAPAYWVLSASKLTPRYKWNFLRSHPLEHLILGREDIEDKGKADSFVKTIAVLQIAWLVLNVIARAIKKLPITQIEIATIAFTAMAILTYSINWWKSKDVSQPIRLLPSCEGFSWGSDETRNIMKSFMIHLRQPHRAEKQSRTIPLLKRVPNDWVWMEGQTPLFYHLLGFSSLVFGSLHCIAWDFEFPTKTELFCWRVASLLSATLPGISLGLSMGMGYLRTQYFGRKCTAVLLHSLHPLERITEEKWKHLLEPKFFKWDKEVFNAFMSMPKDSSTQWDVRPSQEILEAHKGSGIEEERLRGYSDFIHESKTFYARWQLRQHTETQPLRFGEEWLYNCRRIATLLNIHEFRDIWRGYEDFIERKLGIPPASQPDTSFVEMIVMAYEEANDEIKKLESILDLAVRVVEGLNGCGGILYIACRLMTIVLLFTCLRATPSGVYQVVPWTIYIPGIS